jgi:putative ABC transport system permease protein
LNFRETVSLSFESIKINKLRTAITALIIAIGITALVGILSSIDAMKIYLGNSFTEMGANTFNIKNRSGQFRVGGKRQKHIVYRQISYDEAVDFKRLFNFPSTTISNSVNVSRASTAKYLSNKTNPNSLIFGVDENYLGVSGYKLANGRNISLGDMESLAPVAIIGSDIQSKLFPNNENPIDKIISVGGVKVRVIGVMESKGNSAGFGGGDKIIYVPLTYAKSRLQNSRTSYGITVQVDNPEMIDAALSEATGVFRKVRKIHPLDENNFETTKSDSLAKELIKNLSLLTLAATIIGFITIFGAAIGLMNIMLVTVTERTREIGIRKSLGATQAIIRKQFLYEAITICQLGGAGGIILGILIGNGISAVLGVGFIIPWTPIVIAVVLCTIVGLAAGYYPAQKASKLDPIDALRFE